MPIERLGGALTALVLVALVKLINGGPVSYAALIGIGIGIFLLPTLEWAWRRSTT